MDKERRYRMLMIEEQAILAILRGELELVQFDLPDDARVVAIQPDFQSQALAIAIESAMFDPVPLGMEIPRLIQYPAFRRKGTLQ